MMMNADVTTSSPLTYAVGLNTRAHSMRGRRGGLVVCGVCVCVSALANCGSYGN